MARTTNVPTIEAPAYSGPTLMTGKPAYTRKTATIVDQWFRWSDCTPHWERPGKSENGFASLRVQATVHNQATAALRQRDPRTVWMSLSATEAGDKSRKEAWVTLDADQMRALRDRINECLGD